MAIYAEVDDDPESALDLPVQLPKQIEVKCESVECESSVMHPPDGGYGWVIAFASFGLQGIRCGHKTFFSDIGPIEVEITLANWLFLDSYFIT